MNNLNIHKIFLDIKISNLFETVDGSAQCLPDASGLIFEIFGYLFNNL